MGETGNASDQEFLLKEAEIAALGEFSAVLLGNYFITS